MFVRVLGEAASEYAMGGEVSSSQYSVTSKKELIYRVPTG